MFKRGTHMDRNVDLSVAINIIDRKIAELNLKILKNNSQDLKDELDRFLNIRKQINEGNTLLVEKIINNEEV
jgi:hypothetical protein